MNKPKRSKQEKANKELRIQLEIRLWNLPQPCEKAQAANISDDALILKVLGAARNAALKMVMQYAGTDFIDANYGGDIVTIYED